MPIDAKALETTRVGIASKYLSGISRLSDDRDPQHVVSIYEALTTAWQFDAHFTVYHVPGMDVWPRINLSALPEIRNAGADVKISCLALDYDNPQHGRWSPGEPDNFLAYLASFASQPFKLPAQYSAAYTTRGGARLIWILSRPISPEAAGSKLRGLIQVLKDGAGIKIDPTSDEWNRFYRLPHVLRDEEWTHKNDYFRISLQHYVTDPNDIPDISGKPHASSVAGIHLEMPLPTPEECYAELFQIVSGSNRYTYTEWYKDAAMRLRGRECEPIIRGQALIRPGERNNTLLRVIGEACAMLSTMPSTTPQKVYALFDQTVTHLEPDESTPDWRIVAWSMVLRIWGKEVVKKAKHDEAQQVRAAQTDVLADHVLEGMRKWCEHPGLFQDRESSIRWMLAHSILAHGRHFYVLQSNGHFDSLAVNQQQIHARVRELGMSSLIKVEKKTDKGVSELAIQTLINRYTTLVRYVEGSISIPRTTVVDMETDRATLKIKMYQRKTNLQPLYNRDVDEWLQSWCSKPEDYDDLCAWIGHALNFEGGPICALSLAGPPGCGKKLLMMGLVECIDTETFGDEREFGQFQHSIGRSPYIFINEGLPQKIIGTRDIADTFRHYVGGDPIQVNEKFQAPKVVRNPLRIVFAANNHEVLAGLYGHRDLSPEDRDAISQRILHIDIDTQAGGWLRMRGGHTHTGKFMNRWIRGDDGADSDYVVARHFLWLHANRPAVVPGSRFLVEGRLSPELLRSMSMRSGNAPLVIEAVIGMIESSMKPEGIEYDKRSGGIKCTTSSVVVWFYKNMAERGVKLNYVNVASVFKGLTINSNGKSVSGVFSRNGAIIDRRRFHLLDPEKLLMEALEHGYKCDRLKELCSNLTRPQGT